MALAAAPGVRWSSPITVLLAVDHTVIRAVVGDAAVVVMELDMPIRDLVAAIRAVVAGETDVGRRRGLAATCAARFAHLSGRERQVMRLVAAGHTGPETGRALGIAAKSVETYKRRIERKLGLAHRPDYVRFAVEAGLLRP
jgi:DNA-binding NarL/FixJ family response regulator